MRILIAGCGIGGLTAAIALQRAGHSVRLFEQSDGFAAIGAGITIGPAATRVLTALGLGDALDIASDPPRPGAMIHYRTNAVFGTTQKRLEHPELPENRFNLLHRADLHALLRSAVLGHDPEAITTGVRFDHFEQGIDGVVAHFDGGASAQGDLLIGADGLRSRVRECLFGNAPPRFTGQVAYRCLIPFERVEALIGEFPTAVYLGPERTLVRYLICHGTALNCVAFVKTDEWAEESWSCPTSVEELSGQFAGWHPTVLAVFSQAPAGAVYKWALFDREPLPRWSSGRVTLLGDAAHPMLPFLGLGAAMAIEDAMVLARALAAEDGVSGGLGAYEASRRDRTSAVMRASRDQGAYFQAVDIDNFTPSKATTSFDDYDATQVALTAAQ